MEDSTERWYSVDSNVLGPSGDEDLCEEALLLALVVHGGLVSLNFDNGIARGDGITDLLAPLAHVSTGHGRGEGRHADLHMGRVV